MRLSTKSPALRDAFSADLRGEGVDFKVVEKQSHETFVGYIIEGTLEEIRAKIEVMEGVDREALMEGFNSFRESINHILDHLKAGESADKLLSEGLWVADVLDQLYNAGALDYNPEENTLRLKEGIDPLTLRFQFKFPFNLVTNPEGLEKVAKQFVFTDLTPEWEFEVQELRMEKINAFGRIASKYFPEEDVLKAYFALVGRSILAGEILKALGDRKVDVEEFKRSFLRALPMQIPTEKGTLVVHASKEAFDELLRFLERKGYLQIKAGKMKKLRDL